MLTGISPQQGPASWKPQFAVRMRTRDHGSIASDDTVNKVSGTWINGSWF
jgi:hypothetical protein